MTCWYLLNSSQWERRLLLTAAEENTFLCRGVSWFKLGIEELCSEQRDEVPMPVSGFECTRERIDGCWK